MMLPKYKFPKDRRCPKCQALAQPTFCASDCWFGPGDPANLLEHLHWKCNCSFEWLTGTAEGKESGEKLSRED